MDCSWLGKQLPAFTMSGTAHQSGIAAVVVAAGKGLRAGQPIPKQFAPWRGKPVVRHSVEALAKAGIAPICVVIPEGADDIAAAALQGIAPVTLVTGGSTRQHSVRNGLESLVQTAPSHVLIHDAARPDLPKTVIDRLCDALESCQAAIPVIQAVDSLLRAENGMMMSAVDRTMLRRVQTPQAFHFQAILDAHNAWAEDDDAGDDAQVAQAAGMGVALVEGDERLHKLTFEADFQPDLPTVRVGTGYDVHRLGKGEELWLGGIKLEYSHGLIGHSDGDVLVHALVDAMLGAIGAGDIGQHFPPSDAQWRGAPSGQFLEYARRLVADSGYRLGNADITIICEAPKIAPHREAIREKLAAILGVDIGLVSVKATTTEGLGFTGRQEGIAAQAMVNLVRKWV